MSPEPRWLTNSARLEAVAHELRPALAEVGVDRLRGRRADGHDPLLGALAAGAQDADLEVDVGRLEVDRLRGAQAAGVHQLEQRAVAQGGGLGAAGLVEQLGDLVAAEHVRQAAALLGRAQVGGRVGLEDVLAAQVAIERAQAGDLALERRRRDRRLLAVARGEAGDEARQVGVRDRERVAAVQVVAELEQVAAVGLERVARQAALELEVGEEVQDEVLERLGGRGRGEGSVGDRHLYGTSPPPRQPLWVQALCHAAMVTKAVERDQRLGVPVGGEDLVELSKRDALDVDALVLLDRGALGRRR